MSQTHPAEIRSQLRPNCHVCGAAGRGLYADLTASAPGNWSLKQCPNPACALAWLDPMPLEADLGQAYRRYFTHQSPANLKHHAVQYVKTGYLALRYGYRADSVGVLQRALGLVACLVPFRRVGLDALVGHLCALPHGRLLDVGCGDGQIVEFMQGLGWQAEGVDFDPAAVEIAKGKGLRVHVGTLPAQAYVENSFDAIVLSHFIEHVPDPLVLLCECRRILRPGGRLIVLTPNISGWAHRKFGRAWFALDPPRHLHLFTPASLSTLVERSGLQVHTSTTSLRNIGTILLGSCAIQHTSRFERHGPVPLPWRLRTMFLQFSERLAWKHNPELGEEIDLVAEKTDA